MRSDRLDKLISSFDYVPRYDLGHMVQMGGIGLIAVGTFELIANGTSLAFDVLAHHNATNRAVSFAEAVGFEGAGVYTYGLGAAAVDRWRDRHSTRDGQSD